MNFLSRFSHFFRREPEPELKIKMERADQLVAALDEIEVTRKKTINDIVKALGKECDLDNEFRDLFGLGENTK